MFNIRKLPAILIDGDYLQWPQVCLFVALYFAVRLPFIHLGFGADLDAWQVARSAHNLYFFQDYQPSRLPGYPLPEILYSFSIGAGYVGTNIATAIVSLISVFYFAKILRRLSIKNRGALLIAYAFLPILMKNSVTTMDHMWSLSFLVISLSFALDKRLVPAGLIMGLAVGSRLSSAVFLLPFLYLVWRTRTNKNDPISFLTTSVIFSAIWYVPLYLKFGTGFVDYYPPLQDSIELWTLRVGYYGLYALGSLPTFYLIVQLFWSSRKLLAGLRSHDTILTFLALCIVVMLIEFLRFPYEPEYLIPMMPFVVLLVGKLWSRRVAVVFCALALSNAIVTVSVTWSATGDLSLNTEGLMFQDFNERSERILVAQEIIDSQTGNHSVVVIGMYVFEVAYLVSDANHVEVTLSPVYDEPTDTWYTNILSLQAMQSFLNENYRVFCLDDERPNGYYADTISLTEQIQGYNPIDLGCSVLRVP